MRYSPLQVQVLSPVLNFFTMEDFDSWFDVFTDKCKSLGYTGPIDRESFMLGDYDNDVPPEESAKAFVEEMNS